LAWLQTSGKAVVNEQLIDGRSSVFFLASFLLASPRTIQTALVYGPCTWTSRKLCVQFSGRWPKERARYSAI
jgi:hypothetical protein